MMSDQTESVVALRLANAALIASIGFAIGAACEGIAKLLTVFF